MSRSRRPTRPRPLVLLAEQLLVDADVGQLLDPAVDFGIKNGLAVHHRADLVGVEGFSQLFGR